MYGLIGRMLAVSGQRDALAKLMVDGMTKMPGCLSYVVALDSGNGDAIWISEVWEDAASHKASLGLSSVQDLIAKARPLIAGMDNRVETTPLGGVGIGDAALPRL